jgi:hypothetical protein
LGCSHAGGSPGSGGSSSSHTSHTSHTSDTSHSCTTLQTPPVSCKKPPLPDWLAQKQTYHLVTSALCTQMHEVDWSNLGYGGHSLRNIPQLFWPRLQRRHPLRHLCNWLGSLVQRSCVDSIRVYAHSDIIPRNRSLQRVGTIPDAISKPAFLCNIVLRKQWNVYSAWTMYWLADLRLQG